MSRLSTAPHPNITSNINSRIVEITIHCCHGVITKKSLGVFEKRRDFFVNVTVGNQDQRTSKRPGGNESLEWNEKLVFHNVQKSTLTLGLYYDRALLKPKLVSELTIPLPETQGDILPTLSRTATFRDGPQIQWTLFVKDSRPRDVAEDNNKGQSATNHINQSEISEGEGHSEEREAVEGAKQALESQSAPKSIWKQVLEGIWVLKEVASPLAEVHPFAKLACTIFFVIAEPLIRQLERDEDMKTLLASLISFCDIVANSKNSELGENEKLRRVLKRASLQITDVAFFVRDYCKDGGFAKRALKNVVSNVDDDIKDYCLKLEGLKEEYRTWLAMETGGGVARIESIVAETEIKVVRVLRAIEDIAQAINLDDIAYVSGAGLDIDKMCLAGTRTEILEEIMEWISLDGSRVMWLCGGAGTGKSAIAHTIAARFKQLGRLGSIFCFSDAERAARKPGSLFPHISRDLADLDVNLRHELCKAAQNKADRTTSNITTQFEQLVLTPANAIRDNMHGPIVIIIDALDESGTVEERRGLLRVLGSKLKELPPNFRVIITSRPDLDIQIELSSQHDVFVKRMHAIPARSTAEDIATFVAKQLAEVPGVNGRMCQDLASYSRGLFQWAKVACDFVQNYRLGETAQDRYEELTRPLASKTGPDEMSGDILLDYLYLAVLSKVLLPARKAAMDNFKFVMARILAAFEPLSCNSLNQLFTKSNSKPRNCKAEMVVVHLDSVLSGVDNPDNPIRPLHTSFRDFLTDQKRSGEFFVDVNNLNVHLDITSASLQIMKEELKFNICRLPTSHLANKDIPEIDTLIAKYISPSLSYACRFWAAHFCSVTTADPFPTPQSGSAISTERWSKLVAEVEEFLGNRALCWLEILSLLGASNSGLQQIRRVCSLAKTKNMDKACFLLIEDLERFWSYFAKCIATSAAHIYISALPFAPEDSLVAKRCIKSSGKTLSIMAGRLQGYPSCLNILHGHTNYIFSVACSPDGTRIASGSVDQTIRVWNAESGEMLVGPLYGHTDDVTSIAFSPDGDRIASGSGDNSIRVWNTETGEIALEPLRGHTSRVRSVVFSPDGNLIASCSDDNTIRLWSAENGKVVLGPFEGHTDWVRSVSFSPQGTLIASGSDDMTIRIWSVENGEIVLAPLTGHTDGVWSVAFSPDGTSIASGSRDNTIRIWNTENGEMALGPLEGHTGFIGSVAFSPNGTRLVSASYDATIRVWNAENGQMVLGPLEGHTAYIVSAVFSPDGTRLVSGSYDHTVRVWNTEHQQIEIKPLRGHTDGVMSVLPSTDGTRITSASFDKTIRVWNIENGEAVLGPLSGHTEGIVSASLSSDGTRIASASADRTICIWNLECGAMILGPLEGHTDEVWSVRFSLDDSLIVSGSRDETVRVWSTDTGDVVLGPLEGHTDPINSAVFSPDNSRIISAGGTSIFIWNAKDGEMTLGPLEGCIAECSPDGTFIVSGSIDGTIRIWDAKSGNILRGPLNGHTDWVTSLAFSPDGTQFVSGSYDGTIHLWDVESGDMIFGLLGSHADTVRSVAFSPDGRRIFSGSSDASIRVWNMESIKIGSTQVSNNLTPISSAMDIDGKEAGLPNWRLQDGWALGENDELLFYVPPAHQLSLWGPRTELIISRHQTTKLDFSRFVHGTHWAECFDSGVESDAA